MSIRMEINRNLSVLSGDGLYQARGALEEAYHCVKVMNPNDLEPDPAMLIEALCYLVQGFHRPWILNRFRLQRQQAEKSTNGDAHVAVVRDRSPLPPPLPSKEVMDDIAQVEDYHKQCSQKKERSYADAHKGKNRDKHSNDPRNSNDPRSKSRSNFK